MLRKRKETNTFQCYFSLRSETQPRAAVKTPERSTQFIKLYEQYCMEYIYIYI